MLLFDFARSRAARMIGRPLPGPAPISSAEEPTIIRIGDLVQCPDGATGRVMYFNGEHRCVVALGGRRCGTHRDERTAELLLVEESH